jgi:hypothetical protein
LTVKKIQWCKFSDREQVPVEGQQDNCV